MFFIRNVILSVIIRLFILLIGGTKYEFVYDYAKSTKNLQ